jgi:sec-independent protein translocase protein TatB
MFDVGWSEMLVIAVVAIVVVGPKELPRMLRTFGKSMGYVRRTANDFKRQFDEAIREAEREADLADAKKTIQSIGNPLADAKKDLDATMRAASQPSIAPKPVAAAAPAPAAASPAAHEAEPAKIGATGPELGSGAA